ncbi:MAG: hypothetical protein HC822_08135 [Oscillochloris sp.]|nr:hypothetical protein [Oscillochloris sp.]
MDNPTLAPILDELDTHQCWVKPLGWAKHPIAPDADFGGAVIRLDFARPSKRLAMDDFLIVYAVGHRQLCFIGRCNTPVRTASEAEIAGNPELQRWRYWVKAINKTPTLGRAWAQHDIKLFDLVEPHNTQYPANAFSVGSLNYGSDLLRVPASFVRMVVDQVLQHSPDNQR